MIKDDILSQIDRYNISKIVEAVEQTLQNEGSVKDNILSTMREWDESSLKSVLDYLDWKVDKWGDLNENYNISWS